MTPSTYKLVNVKWEKCSRCNGVGAVAKSGQQDQKSGVNDISVCPDCHGLGRIQADEAVPHDDVLKEKHHSD